MAVAMAPVVNADVHREFARTRDPQLREVLVLRHQRLALAIASRFCSHTHDREDRAQAAMIGLLNAIDRFDPERGVSFSTFGWATITGELKRFHRGSVWGPHVPRSLQELHLRVSGAIDFLTTQQRRPPTFDEIAEHTGDSVEAVLEGIELNHARRLSSLDQPVSDESNAPSAELASPLDEARRVEDRLHVNHLLGSLSPRSQEIVRLRFEEELSQSQIAARVGLSQMHVSRLLSQALAVMREVAEAS